MNTKVVSTRSKGDLNAVRKRAVRGSSDGPDPDAIAEVAEQLPEALPDFVEAHGLQVLSTGPCPGQLALQMLKRRMGCALVL